MIARFLETFFRYKLLILLPFFMTPLIVVPFSFLLVKPYYETTAGLWVERPSYVPSTDDAQWNRYVTPAQNEVQRLTELLKTRSFTDDIARRTSLSPLLDSPEGRDELFEYLGRVIYPVATGNKLMTIRVRAEDPQLSMEIITGDGGGVPRAQPERADAGVVVGHRLLRAAAQGGERSDDGEPRPGATVHYVEPARRHGRSECPGAAASTCPTSAVDPQLSELLKGWRPTSASPSGCAACWSSRGSKPRLPWKATMPASNCSTRRSSRPGPSASGAAS